MTKGATVKAEEVLRRELEDESFRAEWNARPSPVRWRFVWCAFEPSTGTPKQLSVVSSVWRNRALHGWKQVNTFPRLRRCAVWHGCWEPHSCSRSTLKAVCNCSIERDSDGGTATSSGCLYVPAR